MRKIIFLFLLLTSTVGFSQITVDVSLTTQQLIEDVLINSSCAEVSNFIAVTGTDFGDDNGIAAFDANGSGFPFESGIVLTSGNVLNAPGPNLTLHSDGGFGWPGDADLETYTTATNTNNATYVQFDFVPSINQVSFDFIMASEEYNQNFECTFSDAFAFILTDQATGAVQNLAVLPGTTIPIEVTNIRPEVAGQCAAVNEQYFDKYNFEPFNPAANAAIDFNGQTVVLTAVGDVIAGNTYTIKLVVADETDTAYDIAVFLGANSFNIGNVDLGDDILLTGGNAVCEGNIITLDAGNNPDATYQWFKDGILIPGETNSTLDISETAIYGVEIQFSGGQNCVATDEILVEFFPNPIFDLGVDQLVCDQQFITLDATVSNPSELQNIMYKWFVDGVEIPGETNSTLDVSQTGLYSAEVTGNGCVVTDEVNVELVAFQVEIGDTVELCGEDSFEIVPVITGADASGATYLWSTGETTSTITVTQDGTYTVEVTIMGCTESDDVTIVFKTLPQIELGDTIIKCAQDVETLTVVPSNIDVSEVTFRWFKDGGLLENETSNTLDVTEEGIYKVEVDDNGCVASDTIEVEFYDNENCVITQGISPNGDSQNDFLDLEFLDDKSDVIKLTIFNRQGLLVYEKEEYVNEWGGQTDAGDILPVGTYYYVIELRTADPITGWIYLNK
jgi:gliding motility-associated-like protein